jgi:hypothetical protein
MSKARQGGKSGLEVFADAVKTAAGQEPDQEPDQEPGRLPDQEPGQDLGRLPAPVHLWNPPFCGDIDMRIAADGTWFYHGTPIGRPALVKLFASVLKREGDNYYLVTPAEKCGIVVDDAPFTAVELAIEDGGASRELRFRTNVDDWVTCGPGHSLQFVTEAVTGGLKPYVHVRADLWAKVTRAVLFELVALGETREVDGTEMFGVASAGEFYAMAPADGLEDVKR